MEHDQPREQQRVTAAQFAAKFRSKREIFTFLTVEAKAYLSNVDSLSIYYLRDLASGKKKCKLI